MRSILYFLLVLALVSSQQITCTTGQTYVKFTKKCGSSWASEESFEIYSAGTKIYTSPTFANSETRVIEQCLAASTNNQYQVKMKDSYGDSWYNGAFLQIEGPYGNRVFKAFLADSSSEEYTFSLYMPIKKTDTWKLSSGSVTGSWTEYNFPDSSWTEVTLGSVTTPVSGTQYFRKQFVGLASMSAYEVSMNYRYGIVAYINGAEIFRDNMPDGTPSGSTAASGSYPTVEYHAIIRPGIEVANAQSVLAIEVHFSTSGQTFVDFDCYLAIYASTDETSNCYNYAYDVTITSSGGTTPENMIDYGRSSSYYMTASNLPATVQYTFSGPKPYINGIRVWPYSSATSAPSTFTLQGSNSLSSTWTNAIVASNLVHVNNEYMTVNGFFNTGLYNNYRLQITGSSLTYVYAYEVQTMICSIGIPTSIVYEPSTISAYARYEDVTIRSVVTEFTNCQITPTPPEGLVFDSLTCTLTGTAMTAGTTTYTVNTVMNGQTYTGSFTLQIIECAGTLVDLRRVYTYNSVYEGYTLKDTAGTVIVQENVQTGQVNNVETHTILCLTSTKYTLTLVDSLSYWYYNSFIYINALLDGSDDFETIIKVRGDTYNGLPASHSFNAQFSIKPMETWHYKMGEVPANWYNSETSGWTSGTAGSFPASSNQIQLYKKTFTVSSLTDVAGLVVSLKYQYGVIIYLNNHEVFRKGFTGDLSTSTYSTTSLSNVNFRQISLPIKTMSDGTTTAVDYVTTGTNTIAIGLIAAGSAQTTASFDCAVRLVGVSSVSRFQDIYSTSYSAISGSPSYIPNKYYGYTTYYSTCNSNYIYWTLPDDRHEWISSVVVKLYYTQSDQQPREFIVKAKNAEDSTWTTLKTVTGLTWSLAGQSQRIWLFNNKAYNMFRFENIGTGDPSNCAWKINYFDLLMDAVQTEVPSLSYSSSSVSIFKDIEMGELYPNSEFFTGYTVTPNLPNGITVNPETGVISGMASQVVTAQSYTISAKKLTGETVTAQISISVDVCTGGKSLVTLVTRADSYPTESSWKVYQGKGMSGAVVESIDQLPVASALSYGDFCLNHGIYTLEIKDTTTGWNIPAGYYMTVDVGEMKFEMGQVYSSTSPASITKYFSSYLPFQIEYDDWKVFKGADIAENWKAIDFDDSTWTVTKAAQIGTNEAITTYIRREVTLDDVANYQVLNVRVRYAGGVVAYFNGRRVARFNIDDGFDAETESIAVHDATKFSMFHIVLNTVGAVTGKNIMAFEIHRPYGLPSSEPVQFDATGVFGVNDCSIGVDSVINISGTAPSLITDLKDFFDLTPVTYGYQSNTVGTYLQWTVENLEGTKFNSFALETSYAYSSWGFSLYGREIESLEDDDPDAEEYISMYEGVNQSTLARGRTTWDVPVGIAGFRQFKHEIDDTASSTIYIAAYIFQYCKSGGTGSCPGVDDYPPVGEGQISPADCDEGFRGYSYRTCSGGSLGPVQTDKCIYKEPARMRYDSDRYTLVMNTDTSIPAPRYQNLITKFYLAENTFLPDGLFIDETTGIISGKPTEESGLKVYTIYGSNPSGVTFTTINISVRKGECRAEGNFPKTDAGEVAVYDCAVAGSYVGTQRRACILGVRDGEWQKIQGVCMPIFMIIFLVILGIVVIGVVGMFVMRATKKTKAVGGVKGKKSSKSGKNLSKKSTSVKTVKV